MYDDAGDRDVSGAQGAGAYIHRETHTDTQVHTQTHADTHKHTHTHTYTHTHTHTHTHVWKVVVIVCLCHRTRSGILTSAIVSATGKHPLSELGTI